MQVEPNDGACARTSRRTVGVAAILAFVLALLVKLPQLGFTHREPDEFIYWQLAQRFWQDGVYSLRGTAVFEQFLAPLAGSMYDHPVFHHPPLFAALLGPWAANSAALDVPATTLLVPWIGHAVFAAATIALGLRLARTRADRTAIGLGVVAVALDPFGWFASRYLWIDGVSMGLAAAAVWCAVGASSTSRQLGAGALAAACGMAKLTGFLVLPVLLLDRVLRARSERRARDLALLAVPSIVAAAAWLFYFEAHTGAALPTWLAPTDEILARDALMRSAFERSPLHLLGEMALIQPLALWVVAALFVRSKASAGRPLGGSRRAVAAWLVLGAAAIVATSALGATPMLTRQFAAVVPALYVLAIALLVEQRGPIMRSAFAIAALVGAVTGGLAVHSERTYELHALLRP